MSQPLGIVGASTRSAAASAVRAGFQPLAADLFADADLRRIATATRISPYPEGLVDWLRTVEPPAWMYTGALENHPELVDQMAWIAPLWGNPGDVLTRVRSPWELASVLQSAGLLFPETRASAEGLPADGSWLVKTYRGASGSGVDPLSPSFSRSDEQGAVSASVYQRRVSGIPCAAIYVASNSVALLLGITRQLIGEPWLGGHGFQYAGSIGPWPVSESVVATLDELGSVLAAEFELTGLFGVDFMLDGDRVWTLEVNPRYTASVEIVERFTGVSAIATHAVACGAASSDLPPMVSIKNQAETLDRQADSTTATHGKVILFAKHDLTISNQFAEWSFAESLRTPWPALGDISPAGSVVEQGRPILTMFADGEDVDVVYRRLRERSAEIESRL